MKSCYKLFLLSFLLTLAYLSCSSDKSQVTVAKPSTPDTTDYSFQMGVNLNEQADVADMRDIQDSKTRWVRSFVEVIDLYKAGNINTDAKIAAYNSLKAKGYKTVLSLKFNFLKNGFPAKDGQDWNNYLSFINTLLAKVMPYTDVLVVGNEPFIEAAPATWNEPLNSFYKAACNLVHNYFEQNNINKPIFLGAFDNMYQSAQQTNAGYLNLLTFARTTSYLAGIDLHIHHNTASEMTSALQFAASKIRTDQKMLVTEFSLMKYWRSYNDSAIAPAFLKAAAADPLDSIKLPPATVTKNYQYIDYALKNPRPAAEWYAFWANSPYLAAKSSYLCTAYQSFLATGNVYLSFYALRQSYPDNTDFMVSTAPWVLNGLYLNRSVRQVDGRNQKSYSFLDQFQKIAQNENPCE